MTIKNVKLASRLTRKTRIRKKADLTGSRHRLTVYRSLKHTYAQIIDDIEGKTIASSSTKSKDLQGSLGKGTKKLDAAKRVGEFLAKKAVEKNVRKVWFDRNGFRYHGRIKALADAAREHGLEF